MRLNRDLRKDKNPDMMALKKKSQASSWQRKRRLKRLAETVLMI
jgi:hypothetical protein